MNYRAKIKAFAKQRLSCQYGTTLGACLLIFVPVLALIFVSSFFTAFLTAVSYYMEPAVAVVLLSIQAAISAFVELVTYSMMPFSVVGISAFMLSAVRGVRKKCYFPYAHGAKKYGRKLGGCLWQMLFTLLWAFLFVIPGVVKGYSYSFNPYILADCPNLTAREALNLSKKMTNGIKGELFVFDLSFIGWWLLTILTGGILAIYTVPYYLMAKATLYESMKNSALASGKITELDLDPTLVYRNENYSQN